MEEEVVSKKDGFGMENTNGYHKFWKRHPLVSWDATKYIPSLIENILNQLKIQGTYILSHVW